MTETLKQISTKPKTFETKTTSLPSLSTTTTTITRDTVFKNLYETNSFKVEIRNLLLKYPGISSVDLSNNSKVTNVSLDRFLFEQNTSLTGYEKKLGFEEIAVQTIPEELNFLRIIILLIENIQKDFIKDCDFYGEWITRSKNARVDYEFALNTIRELRENAIIVSELYGKEKTQAIKQFEKTETDLFEKCENDMNAGMTKKDQKREKKKKRQISETIHRDMAKFIITIFLLNKLIRVISIRRHDSNPSLASPISDFNRICTLQKLLSNILYRLYCDYFRCQCDSQGYLKIF